MGSAMHDEDPGVLKQRMTRSNYIFTLYVSSWMDLIIHSEKKQMSEGMIYDSTCINNKCAKINGII